MLIALLVAAAASGAAFDNSGIFQSRCGQANTAAVCACAADRLQVTAEGRYFLGMKAVTSRPSAERIAPKAALLAEHGLSPAEPPAAAERAREAARAAIADCRQK